MSRMKRIIPQDLEMDADHQILERVKKAYRNCRTFRATGTYWFAGMSEEQSFSMAFQKRTNVTPDYFFLDYRRDTSYGAIPRTVVWCRGWRCFTWDTGGEIEKARNFSLAMAGTGGIGKLIPELLFNYGGSYEAFRRYHATEFVGTDRLFGSECLRIEATNWELLTWDHVLRQQKLPEVDHHLEMEKWVEYYRSKGIENPHITDCFWIDPQDFLIRKTERVTNDVPEEFNSGGYALYYPEIDMSLDADLFHFTPPSS